MAYSKYYSGGWKSGEVGATPITPAALNHIEEGIVALDTRVPDTGAITVVTPTTADALNTIFASQAAKTVVLIPSGSYEGVVVGPDGNAGGAGWLVISHKYSNAMGYQWGLVGWHIYCRQFVSSANPQWTAWSAII